MTFWRAFRVLGTFAPLALSAYNLMSWEIGGAVCVLGVLSILLEAWLERTKPAGTDALEGLVLLETAAIIGLLAGLNLVVYGGFLAIVPFMFRRSNQEIGPRTAFVGAALVLFAGWATGQGWIPSSGQIAAAGGIAFLAWALTRTTVVTPTYLQMPVPAAFAPVQPAPDEQYETLRERYSSLRTEFRNLEQRSEASKATSKMIEWLFEEDRNYASLAKLVRDFSGVKGVAIFVVPDARDGFTLAGSSGAPVAEDATLTVSLQSSPIVMRESAQRALRTTESGASVRVETVLLTRQGRLVGLAALFDEDRAILDAAITSVQSVSQVIGGAVQDEHNSKRLRERVAQLDLLNRFAGRQATGPAGEVARTICSDVIAELALDGCAIVDLTGIQPKPIGVAGESVTDLLEFPSGPDLRGWMGIGAPEVVIDDARRDERCDEVAALRRGIGALMIQPLISSGSLIGALVSWTAKRRGISSVAMSTLRALTPHVLQQVFGGFASSKPGLVDADTFWQSTQGPGSFVELDLGRLGAVGTLEELQQSRRQLLTTAMGRLPHGGLMTRRSAGTLLAFLPGYDETAADRWAEALRPYADEKWEMRVDGRGQSQQSRQFFDRISA